MIVACDVQNWIHNIFIAMSHALCYYILLNNVVVFIVEVCIVLLYRLLIMIFHTNEYKLYHPIQ